MTPDFDTWQPESLAKFARESSERIKDLEEANEQLRRDLRDAMDAVRRQLSKSR